MSRPKAPIRDVETPPFAQFWVVSIAAAATTESRDRHEALARAMFRGSLTRQHRRPIDEPELTWVPARVKRGRGLPTGATPLASDLRACKPGQAARWWLLVMHARTVPR
jgi:hypothetical protein